MAEMEYNERYAAIEAALDRSKELMKENGIDFKYMVTESYGGKVFHGVFNVKIDEETQTNQET